MKGHFTVWGQTTCGQVTVPRIRDQSHRLLVRLVQARKVGSEVDHMQQCEQVDEDTQHRGTTDSVGDTAWDVEGVVFLRLHVRLVGRLHVRP